MVFHLLSCVREVNPGRVLSEAEQASCMEYGEVGFSLGDPSFLYDVESTKAQALAGADNRNLGGALVLIYRSATQTLDSYEWFTPVQLSSGASLKVRVPLVPCDVYILGNVLAVMKNNASVTANLMEALGESFPVRESDLESFVYRLDGGSLNGVSSSSWRTETMDEVRQYGIPYQFVEKNVDMYSVFHNGLPFPSGPATWLFSKVVVTVDHSAFDGGAANFADYFLNNSMYIRQPNLKFLPFSSGSVSSAEASDRGVSDLDGDRDVSMSQAHAGSYVFFVPENMKGTVSSVDDSSKKNKDNGSIPSSVRDYATFLEFRGSLGPAAGGFSGDVKYQFYLGGNATTDFNLQRGKAYNVTLYFTVGNLFGSPKWMVSPSLTDHRRFQITADSSFSTDIETVNSNRLLAVRKNRPGKVYVYMNPEDVSGGSNSLLGKDVISPSSFTMGSLGDCSWYGDFMTAGTADAQWLAERGIVVTWDKTDGSLSFRVDPAKQAQFDAHVGEEKVFVLRLLPLETKTATVKVKLVPDLTVSVGDGKSLTDDFYVGQKRTVSVTGFSGSGIHWAAVQQGCGDSSHTNLNDASNVQWKTSSNASAAFPSCAVDAGGRVVLDPSKSVYASQVFSGSLDLYAFYPNRFQAGHGFTSKNGRLVVFGSDWLNDCMEIPVRISEPRLKTAIVSDVMYFPLDGTPRDIPEFGYMDFAGTSLLDRSSFDDTLYGNLLEFGSSSGERFGDFIGVDAVNFKAYCCRTLNADLDLLTLVYNSKGVTNESSNRIVSRLANTATGLYSGKVFEVNCQFSKPILNSISTQHNSGYFSPSSSQKLTIWNYFASGNTHGRYFDPLNDNSSIVIYSKFNFRDSDLGTATLDWLGPKATYTTSHGETFGPVWDVEIDSADTGSGGIMTWTFDETHQATKDSYNEPVPGGILVPYGAQTVRFNYSNRWETGRTLYESVEFRLCYEVEWVLYVGATNQPAAELHVVTPKHARYLNMLSSQASQACRTFMTKFAGGYYWLNQIDIQKAYGVAKMGLVDAQYRVSYAPPVHFPLYNFLASYVGTGSSWTSSAMSSVLNGTSQPVRYNLFPRYLVVSDLPEATSAYKTLYYASGEEFGTLMHPWQGSSGATMGVFVQGTYVPVSGWFTSH